jgi:hypothetical protein
MKAENLFIFGPKVGKYKVPLEFVHNLNNQFDEQKNLKNLKSANNSLIGEIHEEFNVRNILDKKIKDFFYSCSVDYIENCNHQKHNINISMKSCWFNDQKEHEYNPMHVHYGNSALGISSVLFLKVPDSVINAKSMKTNQKVKDGRLQFVFGSNSFFYASTVLIDPVVGDLYLFSYDTQHQVYPFKGEGIRRSLSFNIDIFLS